MQISDNNAMKGKTRTPVNNQLKIVQIEAFGDEVAERKSHTVLSVLSLGGPCILGNLSTPGMKILIIARIYKVDVRLFQCSS